MPKAQVQIGEETQEIDLESVKLPEGYRVLAPGDVPDGYYTKDTLDATVDASWKKKFKKLQSDPTEARAIFEAHGVPLDDEGNIAFPEAKDVDEDQIRERIKTTLYNEQVKPKEEKIKALEERASKLLTARKRGQILAAARKAGVQDFLLESPAEGQVEPIVNLIDPYLGYDDDRDVFAVKDGEGFAPSSKEGKPWADESDLFDRLKKNDAWKHIFRNNQPGNTGLGDTDSSGKTASGFPSKRSGFTRSVKADFFAKMREEGKDPDEEWQKLPA